MFNRAIVTGRQAAVKREMARRMRSAMTPTENMLWQRLRGNKLAGLHFRRQHVIDGFIVDFYCHQAALVVEVDGGAHDDTPGSDEQRDNILSGYGLLTLRFTNSTVNRDTEGVLAIICDIALARLPAGETHPSLSSSPFPTERSEGGGKGERGG